MKQFILILSLALSTLCWHSARADWLWQIGTDDRQYKEFALADSGLKSFDRDNPMFVIGTSDPAKDWPFVHPGPADAWAGNQAHTFGVAFSLADVATQGECKLSVALVDTHRTAPPHLTMLINGKSFDAQMPPGSPLASGSASGHPELGKPYRFEIKFPSDLLKRGPNLIDIVNDKGSWVLYDWLALEAPAGAKLDKLVSFTAANTTGVRGLIERDGKQWQPIAVHLRHVGPDTTATLHAGDESVQQLIKSGSSQIEMLLPAVEAEKTEAVTLETTGPTFSTPVTLEPVRKLTIYVLPHSHNDIATPTCKPTSKRSR